MVKEYVRHKGSIQVPVIVFLCVLLLFLLGLSLFRGLSIILSVKYFFVEADTFKNIFQIEILVIVYLSKKCLLNN